MFFLKRMTDSVAGLILAILCALTLTDYSLMKQCPNREKIAVVHTFFIFVLQLVFIFSLMAATLMIFLPQQQAFAVSALISLSVVAMEVKMIASLWNPQGILSEGIKFKEFGLLAIRLSIALILASAYAISVELYIFGDDIDDKARLNYEKHNADIVNNYQNRLIDKKKALSLLENDIYTLEQKMEQYYRANAKLTSKINALSADKIELERLLEIEDKGLEGRPKGKFERYWTYHNNWSAKNKEIAIVEQEKQALHTRYRSYGEALDKLLEQREQLNTNIVDSDPYEEASRHPNFKQQIPTGLAARYRLLAELKQDPNEGATVLEFSWLIKAVMIVLELIPLIVKVFFTPASIYLELLAAQVRKRTALVRYETKKVIEDAREEYLCSSGFQAETKEGVNDIVYDSIN